MYIKFGAPPLTTRKYIYQSLISYADLCEIQYLLLLTVWFQRRNYCDLKKSLLTTFGGSLFALLCELSNSEKCH